MLLNGLESRLAKFVLVPCRTATKRASGGKSSNNNTAGRRLGPKKAENEFVIPGQIIWRQRGTKWFPGENAGIGRDHTIFAKEPGYVRFYRDPFHAKRRFIGIALGSSDRLPTPHFAPRRRRFGFTEITNDEVAQFEQDFLTRKETQRQRAREQVLAQREESRKARFSQFAEALESVNLSADESQLNRLNRVFQFKCGGLSTSEARKMVDEQFLEDMELDLRLQRVSKPEFDDLVAKYRTQSAEIDSKVTFGLGNVLVKLTEFEQTSRDSVAKQIEDLTKPFVDSVDGTPSDVVGKVLELLSNAPGLSSSDVYHLKKQFLRRPKSILLTKENQAELEKKAAGGAGKITRVWKDGVKRFFVPDGGKVVV